MPQQNVVYVRNLPKEVDDSVVQDIFGCYGEVSLCRVMRKDTLPTCAALISYADPASARVAIDTLHGGIPELIQSQMDPSIGLDCALAKDRDENQEQRVGKGEGKGGKGFKGYEGGKGYDGGKGIKGGKGMHFDDARFNPYPGAGGAPGGDGGYGQRYKTVMCRHFEQGNCSKGDRCSFAHGNQELSQPAGRQAGGGGGMGGPLAGMPSGKGMGGGGGGKGGKGWGGVPGLLGPPGGLAPPMGYDMGPQGHNNPVGAMPTGAVQGGGTMTGTQQISFLKNITHPLLGSMHIAMDQGERGSLLHISDVPSWMDEAGLYFLFAPYGAINGVQLDQGQPFNATLRYVHARAAACAVGQINGLCLDPTSKPLTVTLVGNS